MGDRAFNNGRIVSLSLLQKWFRKYLRLLFLSKWYIYIFWTWIIVLIKKLYTSMTYIRHVESFLEVMIKYLQPKCLKFLVLSTHALFPILITKLFFTAWPFLYYNLLAVKQKKKMLQCLKARFLNFYIPITHEKITKNFNEIEWSRFFNSIKKLTHF